MTDPGQNPTILATPNGYYCGTRVDGSPWRRYRPWGWLTRGNARVWLEADAFCFRLFLTRSIRRIPLSAVRRVEVGRWELRWVRAPVVRIAWGDGQHDLLSGFAVSRERAEADRWTARLAELRPG